MITCHTTEDERWTPMKHIIFASSSKIERAFLLSLIPTPPLSQETTVFFPQQGHLKFDRMFHVPTFKARGLEAKSKSGSMMSLSPGKMPWPNELTIVSTLDAQINQSWVCWACVVTVSDLCAVFYLRTTLVVWKGAKVWLAWGFVAIKENTITVRFVSLRSGVFSL